MKDVNSEIFLIGSGRIDRLKKPLMNVTSVTTAKELLAKESGKISKIIEIYKYLGSNDCIVIGDQLNSKSLLAAELAEWHDLPFLIRPRGTVVGEFKDRNRQLPFWQRQITVAKMRTIRNQIFQKAEGIIPVSFFVKNLIVNSNLASPTDIEVVHVPYDAKLATSGESGKFKKRLEMNKTDVLLTSVTGFTYQQKYRGIVDYARVIDSLLAEQTDMHFAIVGGAKYPVGNETKIQRKAVEQIREQFSPEVQSRLHFPGHVKNMADVYIDSDIFLHLSYRDSLGTVIMEAESFGLPIVVNTGGGMQEMVPEPTGDKNQVIQTHKELKTGLLTLIDDENLRKVAGEQNKIWVENNFNQDTIGEKLSIAINSFI